jgi:hypothetical protein
MAFVVRLLAGVEVGGMADVESPVRTSNDVDPGHPDDDAIVVDSEAR